MEKPAILTIAITIAMMTLISFPGLSFTAEQKPQATTKPKTVTPKAKPKAQTDVPAPKTEACFGVAPQIEKLVPDEGKPGTKVSITGTQFGSPECLRGVSFGPGQSATFSMGNESTILATVPTGDRKGLVILTVTTASGEDSKPFLIK